MSLSAHFFVTNTNGTTEEEHLIMLFLMVNMFLDFSVCFTCKKPNVHYYRISVDHGMTCVEFGYEVQN